MESSSPDTRVTAALAAEAAAWLAILHGPNRTLGIEKGFSEWLKTSPAHARAFEDITEIWEHSRKLRGRRALARTQRLKLLRPLVALTAAFVLAMIGVLLFVHLSGVSTDVGEQRALTFEDGTRVLMNTDTRLVVSYDTRRRRVELKRGEALFEVAKRPDWPFIVTAADRQVTALGTTFSVRRQGQRLAVTLVEGKVEVASVSNRMLADASPPALDSKRDTPLVLTPGQRAIFAASAPVVVDQPELQRLLAWQRREVVFEDTPLLEAIAEMNRYSTMRLVIGQANAQHLHVTGLFRAGDSLSFARAVGEAYELRVVEQSRQILIEDATP